MLMLELKMFINGNMLSICREMDNVTHGHSCLWEKASMPCSLPVTLPLVSVTSQLGFWRHTWSTPSLSQAAP